MGLSARLIAYGHWGVPETGAFHFAITGEASLKQARKRVGGLRNVREIRKDDEQGRGIMLAPSFVFRGADNQKANWIAGSGGNIAHADTIPDNGAYIFAHTKSDSPSHYQSVSYQVPQNGAISINGFIPKPSGERPIFTIQRHRWQLQIIAGRAYLMKQSAAWTQAQEDDMNIALEAEDELTEEQLDIVNTTRESIYDIFESLSIEPGGDGWYGTAWALSLIPEPRGAITVVLGQDGKWQEQTVEDPAITKTRASGVLWPAGPLVLRSTEGSYFVKVGYPSYPVKGQVRTGRFEYASTTGLPDITTGMIADTPPGTDVSIDLEEVDSFELDNGTTVHILEIVANLTTSNPRFTPYLYMADATIQAGTHTGAGSEEFWDSGDLETDPGPIKEVQPQFEGDMRRSQYEIQIRDVNGRTFQAIGNRYEMLENRAMGQSLAGINVLPYGIVQSSQGSNMARYQENQLRSVVSRPNSTVVLRVSDQWALLEETLLTENMIVGDGKYLGAVIREGLRFVGIPDSGMTGVSVTGGVRFSKGVFGEGYSHGNSDGQSVADYLREKIERYGFGDILWQSFDTGIWQFGRRKSTLAQVQGNDANFIHSAAQANTPTTYPGRIAILAPLDWLRETNDFYNYFRVEGAETPDGRRIVHEEYIHESISGGPSNTQSRTFIGRIKPYPTIYDDRIRTQGEAVLVARSTKERYGRPGRYASFETYYHVGLFPGDRITVDGVPCEIERLSGSIREDRMQITAREIV